MGRALNAQQKAKYTGEENVRVMLEKRRSVARGSEIPLLGYDHCYNFKRKNYPKPPFLNCAG